MGVVLALIALMAGSVRFAEGQNRVINGDDEFPPLKGGSKAHPGGVAAGFSSALGDDSSRASSSKGSSSDGASTSQGSAAGISRSEEPVADAIPSWRSLF